MAIAIAIAVILDIGIGAVFWKKYVFPSGALITAFIIAMILSPEALWYIPPCATMLAIISKHTLKIKRRPVFNPAAFGLVSVSFVFASAQNWWGALSTLSPWWIPALLVVGYLIVNRAHKFPQVFAFALVYLGLFTFLPIMGFDTQKIADIYRMPFINSSIFFTAIMLTDPPTSPVTNNDQMLFGMLVALISGLIYLFFGWLSFLLLGLLIGNGFLGWERLSKRLTS